MVSYICTAFLPLDFSKMTSVHQTAHYGNQSTHFNIILVFRKTLSDIYTNISITFIILHVTRWINSKLNGVDCFANKLCRHYNAYILRPEKSLAEMQDKVAYDRPLWSDTSSDPRLAGA